MLGFFFLKTKIKIKFGSGGRNLKRLKISRIYMHIMENVIKKSIECLLLNFMLKYFLKHFMPQIT